MAATSPAEIAARAASSGVAVYREETRLVEELDLRGYAKRSLPYVKEYRYVEPLIPPLDARVIDGMCRIGRSDWLPWETYGDRWCFLDDDPSDPSRGKLREFLYEMEARRHEAEDRFD